MKHIGENVVRIEADALRALADRIAGPMAEAFDRAVELSPASALILFHYAAALQEWGDLPAAEQRLRAALVLKPGLMEARLALSAGLDSGKLLPQRVEQALERIQAAKKRLRPPSGKVSMPALNGLVSRYERFAIEYRREGSNDA